MSTREESSSAAILEALVLAEQLDAAVDGVLRPDRCQASTDPPIVLHHSSCAGRPDQLANSQKKAQLPVWAKSSAMLISYCRTLPLERG